MTTKINNETIGISCEIAIADAFNIEIDSMYRTRGNSKLIEKLQSKITKIFEENNIPKPISHTALNQNPIDFYLEDGSTLSVKSNKRALGKVAPQIIGQPTADTFFNYFDNGNFFDIEVATENLSYFEKSEKFKEIVLNYSDILLREYWNKLFDADHYLHFYNFNGEENYIYMSKLKPILFDKSKITFTQNFSTWNESNTIKYDGNSIGEFQVHRNRNCLKFRFNIKNLLKLL